MLEKNKNGKASVLFVLFLFFMLISGMGIVGLISYAAYDEHREQKEFEKNKKYSAGEIVYTAVGGQQAQIISTWGFGYRVRVSGNRFIEGGILVKSRIETMPIIIMNEYELISAEEFKKGNK